MYRIQGRGFIIVGDKNLMYRRRKGRSFINVGDNNWFIIVGDNNLMYRRQGRDFIMVGDKKLFIIVGDKNAWCTYQYAASMIWLLNQNIRETINNGCIMKAGDNLNKRVAKGRVKNL